MPIAVEICVTSVAEAVAAESCGADAVEVCSWLACGGVTPSPGLVDAVRSNVRLPVRVLIRPMPEGFVHDTPSLHALLHDAETFGAGGFGLVTGGLLPDGSMDKGLMRSVMRCAPDSAITFHRAVDHAVDPLEALDDCMHLGISRMLTSGGHDLALDGMSMIGDLVARASRSLTICAAGGIGPHNVVELVEKTGVQELHFSAQVRMESHEGKASMSSSEQGGGFLFAPDRSKIEGVMNALVKAGLR